MTTTDEPSSALLPAWRSLAVPLLVGVALRVAVMVAKPIPTGDEVSYLEIAEYVARGDGYRAAIGANPAPPFLPVVIAAVSKLTGSVFAASQVLFVIFGALTIVAAAAVGRVLAGARVGLSAAWLVAVFPTLVGAGAFWGQTEGPYVAFVLFGLAWWCRMLRGGGIRAALWSGTALGCAVLCRTEVFALYALLPLSLLRPSLLRAGVLRHALVVAVPIAIALLGRSALNYAESGHFVPDLRMRRASTIILRDRSAYKQGVESGSLAESDAATTTAFGNSPEVPFAQKLWNNGKVLAVDFVQTLPPWYWPFSVAGVLLLWRRRRRALMVVALAISANLAFVLPVFVKASYLALLSTLGVVLAAAGLPAAGRIVRRRMPALARVPLAAALVVFSIPVCAVQPARLIAGDRLPVEYFEAAQWISQELPADALVLWDSRNTGNFSRRRGRNVQTWKWDRVENYVALQDTPVYLAVSSRAEKYAWNVVRGAREAQNAPVVAEFRSRGHVLRVHKLR